MKNIFLLFACVYTISLNAQNNYDTIGNKFSYKNKLEKKILWGFSFTNAWSTIDDADSITVFTKPSLGGGVMLNYFPTKWIGLSLGFAHQQRGFGIITPDVDKSLGNPDSTHRLRIRTNNFNIPIQLMVRTPFDIFKEGRLSIGVGITPTKVYSAKSIFHSIEDGFHDKQDIKNQFISGWDMPIRIAGGLDINAANASLFRIHFFAEFGQKEIYFRSGTTATGKNKLFGLELNFLF